MISGYNGYPGILNAPITEADCAMDVVFPKSFYCGGLMIPYLIMRVWERLP